MPTDVVKTKADPEGKYVKGTMNNCGSGRTLCCSLDKKAAFVGIQHLSGAWPDGEGKPRSLVIAAWREDGVAFG